MAKQKFKIYKLHFTTPIHIGDARDDYSISLQNIASDTMYSALISCLAKVGRNIPSNGDLGCTISSLFPFYQKDKEDKHPVLFFPKPLKVAYPKTDNPSSLKKIKKVSWLDKSYFEKLINGDSVFANVNNANNVMGTFLTEKNIDSDFIYSQVIPRVKIDSRIGQDDAIPFYIDNVEFKDYSGFYFIVDGNSELIDLAINILETEGIGTDRNVGNGFFEVEKGDLELQIPDNSEFVLSLSSFVPESKTQLEDLMNSEEVAYDFQRRGGWITTYPNNTLRKNAIYMFLNGSVFKKNINNVTIMGKVDIDLNPNLEFEKINHPVWRCGRAIFLPIKL